MDLGVLVSQLPTTGIYGVLLAFIALVLRQNYQDRGQYRKDVERVEKRATADLKALSETHTEQMARIDQKLADLQASNEAVLVELDKERRLRWAAEDSAAGFRRELLLLSKGTEPT